MAGGIWEALGAALQQGVGTYNTVSQQQKAQAENEARLKMQQEQQAQEQAYRAAQLKMQQDQFANEQADRQRKILSEAIQMQRPDQAFSEDFIGQVQRTAPDLMQRITATPGMFSMGNVQTGLGASTADNPLGLTNEAPTFSQAPTRYTKQASLGEEADQINLDILKSKLNTRQRLLGASSPLNPDAQQRMALDDAGYNANSILGSVPQSGLSTVGEANLTTKLQKQWDSARESATEIQRQFANMEAALGRYAEDPTGAGQAIIMTFNKILDPSSVVREGEFARTQEGQGLMNRMSGWLESLRKGGPGVPQPVMAQMVETARVFMEKADMTKTLNNLRARTEYVLDRYQIPHASVFGPANGQVGGAFGGATPPAGAAPSTAPTAAPSAVPSSQTMSVAEVNAFAKKKGVPPMQMLNELKALGWNIDVNKQAPQGAGSNEALLQQLQQSGLRLK